MGANGLWSQGVPPGPVWLLWIKIAIIVLSLIVLALSAWALSIYGGGTNEWSYIIGSSGAPGMLIFVVIKTWIIYGMLIAFELKAQQYYYRLIGVVGYILGVIFWLSAWAWAASTASVWMGLAKLYCPRGCAPYDTLWKNYGGAMAGCAAIGAVIWILSIVNLVFFIRGCLADEGTTVTTTTTTTHNAELGHVPKQAEAQTQPQPAYGVQQQQPAYGAQPQQAYGQQPVYGAPQQTAYGQQPAYGAQPQQQQPYPTQ